MGERAGTLYLYTGEGVDNTLLYSQPYYVNNEGWFTFLLDSPIPVTDGEKYTFRLSNIAWRYYSGQDP